MREKDFTIDIPLVVNGMFGNIVPIGSCLPHDIHLQYWPVADKEFGRMKMAAKAVTRKLPKAKRQLENDWQRMGFRF